MWRELSSQPKRREPRNRCSVGCPSQRGGTRKQIVGWDSQRYNGFENTLDRSRHTRKHQFMPQKLKKTPPRLAQVFQKYDPPLYLVTICTLERRAILANPEVHESFRTFGERGREFLIGVGRYVIMPDHIHAFVRIGGDVSLSRWVKGLKRTMDKTLEFSGRTA